MVIAASTVVAWWNYKAGAADKQTTVARERLATAAEPLGEHVRGVGWRTPNGLV
jgi:hypothetical protein